MRRRFGTVLGLRHRAKAEALTWLAAAAMVAQLWLAGPLAMRMAAETPLPAWQMGELCSGHAGQRGADPVAPGRGVDHDRCLICQGAFGPLLLATISLVSIAAPFPPAVSSFALTPLPGGEAGNSYSPRAPPSSNM